MLGVFLLIVLIVGIIGVCIYCTIYDSTFGQSGLGVFICVCSIFAILLGILGGANYLSEVVEQTSPNNYYDMLENKHLIMVDLEVYKEEIHNVLSGNVELIDFNRKEQLIDLNSRIETFNHIVIKHQKYKESFWLYKLYNKDVANLELFPPIFNVIEE
jgi:hypothetical protein